MEGFQVMVANGDIYPSRFVKIDATLTTPNQGNKVIMCSSNDKPIGISQKGTRYTPLSGLDNGLAAQTNQELQVYILGQVAPLEIGGAVPPGANLKSDNNGRGILTTTAGDHYGAISPMAAITTQIVDVQVVLGTL